LRFTNEARTGMLKTRFTELLGVEHPIIQGGMQWVGRANLVAAVSNAGALGFLTALTQPSPDDLRREIDKTRRLTDKPFGVNLTILPTLKPVPYDDYLQAIIDSDVRIIETAGANPEPYLGRIKDAGITVIHKCTSVRHAIKAEKIGVDVVSIDGFECAGHPGEDDVPGLVLFPRAAEEIGLPLIASGGIADARGLVAALALGCDGVNMGSRFLATKEAPIHDAVKRRMLEADERSTTHIFRPLRNTERIFHNTVADRIHELERAGKGIAEIGPLASGVKGRRVLEDGDMEAGIWAVGQCIGLVKDVPTVAELVSRMVREAAAIINDRLVRMIA
jgi:NAD(P)H-dependent flavin oxidoreductase YrpB (nitropropane dioxygenase family)